jgi:NAD(P)-dependent dehydrogenase (short-subunit alcohol dehydrogenase family)
MFQNQANRVVLITGAAKRIGQTIALEMARAGWDVAIHYGHSTTQAEQTVRTIQEMGRRAIAVQADLASETAVERIIPYCIEHLGLPNCIVNNASIFEYDDPATVSYDHIVKNAQVNLAAPLILSKRLFERIKDLGLPQALVIHLLDQKISNLNPDYFSYTLSKSALDTALKMQAMFFAPHLRVMGIAPGITLTSGDQTEQGYAKAHSQVLLGQSSTPEDIAQAVLFLNQAHAMTGSVLYVDGGQHLQASHRDVMFLTEAPPPQ